MSKLIEPGKTEMYIRRTLLKKYLKRIAPYFSKDDAFREEIIKKFAFGIERKLLGEKVIVGFEIVETTETETLVLVSAWQESHWSSFVWCMVPVCYSFELKNMEKQ